jgi:hypothetical protein
VDSICGSKTSKCLIHQRMLLNVFSQVQCVCSPSKVKTQEFHQNNFVHLINAQEVIDMQSQILSNYKAKGKQFRKTELEGIQGKLMGISKTLNNRSNDVCSFSGDQCKHKELKLTHYIQAPFPHLLCLNINWYNNEVPYMDTLRFCTAIPQKFNLSELFDIAESPKGDQTDEQYILKAVVCFLGAHYMTYIKVKDEGTQSIPVWKLFDDYKPIQIYPEWKEIMEQILEYGTLPTMLIYERVTQQNIDFDRFDTVNVDDLKALDHKAYSLQKFIDQYENAEAQAQIKQND